MTPVSNILQELKLQHFINHMAFIIDKSSSMSGMIRKAEQVFDSQIEYLKKRSQELNQETRVSIYSFADEVECLVFDMDVMRMPSLSNQIQTEGWTALLDGVKQAINDFTLLPQTYGDHAFLLYCLTDGGENRSKNLGFNKVQAIKELLGKQAENVTVACLVPGPLELAEAKKFGFQANNLQIWSTDIQGLDSVDKVTTAALDTYMINRSKGIRGSNTMFSDLGAVSSTQIKKALQELNPATYDIYPVRRAKNAVIKEFVEQWTKKPYTVGSTYYELCKSEREVQASKNIIVQNRKNGHAYSGDAARGLLKLPDRTVTLKPGDHGEWRIYIQSTSINRKLPQDSYVLVMR